jgi:8-oxo-dGTP pyrophosphatase MutT (NUDIX family)
VSLDAVPAAWWQALRLASDQPPARPREALRWRGHPIGSIEPGLVAQADVARWLTRSGADWQVGGEDFGASLAAVAQALREGGLVRAWRDEQLAVTTEEGAVLGAVERGVVRLLGIATHAVHLAAWSPDGRYWLQLRAFDKPNDPGKWDTLVGGMVPGGETDRTALERETWEEAGLRFGQLQGLAHGGCVRMRKPSTEVAQGYVVERIDWYRCVLPEGTEPRNQDGEVERFEAMDAQAVARLLLAGAFTAEAALILQAADS